MKQPTKQQILDDVINYVANMSGQVNYKMTAPILNDLVALKNMIGEEKKLPEPVTGKKQPEKK